MLPIKISQLALLVACRVYAGSAHCVPVLLSLLDRWIGELVSKKALVSLVRGAPSRHRFSFPFCTQFPRISLAVHLYFDIGGVTYTLYCGSVLYIIVSFTVFFVVLQAI